LPYSDFVRAKLPKEVRTMTPYKAARIAAGIPSQRQAALKLEMDLAQLRRYEEGENEPGTKILRRMVGAYRLTAGQIVGTEPLPERQSSASA
jgi:transcriptional regulator with XRE-family HTH domain